MRSRGARAVGSARKRIEPWVKNEIERERERNSSGLFNVHSKKRFDASVHCTPVHARIHR